MGWLRNYLRRNTRPIDAVFATKMRNILSTLYFFAAWNTFSYVIYVLVRNGMPNRDKGKETASRYYANVLGTSNAKVYRFSGLSLVEQYEMDGIVKEDRGIVAQLKKEKEDEEREKMEKERLSPEDLELLAEGTSSP